jgi:hypothetical protein
MGAEVRAIATLTIKGLDPERGLGSRIHERFVSLEGGLQVPDRGSKPPRAAVFDG